MTWTKPFIGPKAPWSTALLAIGLMTLFVLLGSQTAFGQTTYVQYGDFDDDGNGNLQWVGTVAPSVDLLDASTLNASFPKDPFGGSLYGVITKTESGAISSSPVRIPTTNSQTLRIMSGFNYDVSILGGVKFEDDTHAPGKGSNNTIIVDNGATVGNISNQTGSVYGGLAINNPASSNNEPSVTQNTVIIDGIIGQSVYGGATNFDTTTYTVDVTHNTVIINEYAQVNGTNDEAGKVVGGSIAYDNDPTATVNFVATKGSVDHNIVTMNGGEVRTIIGGMHELGDTGAIASANEVYIYGGSVTGDIIGGLIFNGVGTVDSNEVTLISGVIDGHVYGGLGDAASGISITGNIINFGIQDGENTGTVAVGNNLYGGFNKDTGGTKATGNTINFYSGRNTVDGT
ncbi:MAG: hypothetical protein LBF58_02000, partial [Deltaproteobacteria bacterium]|nr:hypothetical protein [Deltaproteobacteria bacterium]